MSSRPRLFVPTASAPGPCPLDDAQRHYLTRVLRLTAGDALEVFDGKGKRFQAELLPAGDSVQLLHMQSEPLGREVLLLQGLPKRDKLELVIEKATELGAAAICPVACARSILKVEPSKSAEKTARWQKLAEEAARQSQRSVVPRVLAPTGLAEALGALAPGTALLVLDEAEQKLRLSVALREAGEVPVAVLVGPEGGLTRQEVEQVQAVGGRAVSLGPWVLRTETAGLAALAVIRHLDGQLG